jgi:hypothetical protein
VRHLPVNKANISDKMQILVFSITTPYCREKFFFTNGAKFREFDRLPDRQLTDMETDGQTDRQIDRKGRQAGS